MADVSRETMAKLRDYHDELLRWQASINLIGPETAADAWRRHFEDSLQLLEHIPADATRLVDLGSGAGFPGLVLAVALAHRPGVDVVLIESNQKKAAFLRHIIQRTGAPARVLAQRVEQALVTVAPRHVITARALASLDQLLTWCEPLLKTDAIGIFSKGRGLDQELADAARSWSFDYAVMPSVIAADSSILKVSALRRR